MSNQPSPRADGLRAMREARYALNQQRMKKDRGKTVERPKAVAKNKRAKTKHGNKKGKRS